MPYSPQVLREAGITPLDIDSKPAEEPVVPGWMPAVAVYFHDPDGNLLEFLDGSQFFCFLNSSNFFWFASFNVG